jgi:hypothetical protein
MVEPASPTEKVRISGAGMPDGAVGDPLLLPAGPTIVLGGQTGLAEPIAPSPSVLFGPRGAWLFGSGGPLWVCDTGHHRLLGWTRLPTVDDAPADLVIGQVDAFTEGRNGNRAPDASSLNVPTGVTPFGDGMAVADAWNHRVLVWKSMPMRSNQPADFVLGQRDFGSVDPNRGGAPSASSMHWPYRVFTHEGRLYVADTGNRRVLVWRTFPSENGAPADFALGQRELATRDDNGGVEAGPAGLRWPHDLAIWNGNLVVADAGNNRLLVWDGIPNEGGAPARWVVGQRDFMSVDHNLGRYWPDASALNMPYGVAALRDRLFVADTASSRLLGFRADDLNDSSLVTTESASGSLVTTESAGGSLVTTESASGSLIAARELTGQVHFSAKGDNRWGMPVRDSLCWPYGIGIQDDVAVVCDTGNHRVLIWRLA